MGKRGRKPKAEPVAPPAPDPLTGTLAGDDANTDVEYAGQSRELVRHPTGDDPISEREAKAEEAPTPEPAPEPAKEPERRGFFSNVTRVET